MREEVCVREVPKSRCIIRHRVGQTRHVVVAGYVAMKALVDAKLAE